LKKYIFFLFFVFLFVFFPINALKIEFNEKTICYSPIVSSLTLTVNYKHSVSLTRVVDIYQVNESGITAIQEKWQQFEAGQPLEANVDNGFFVKNMNMYLGKNWEYWFIPLNNVTIGLNGKAVLSGLKDEGKVRFEVLKIPTIIALSRRC